MVCIASHAGEGDASAWLTPDTSYDKSSPAEWAWFLVVFRSLHSIDVRVERRQLLLARTGGQNQDLI